MRFEPIDKPLRSSFGDGVFLGLSWGAGLFVLSIAAGLVAVLTEAGMTVADEAADVERAIAAIKLAAPAVAVVDLDLPDPGGIAVLEALQNAAVPTRVLILAAGSDSVRWAVGSTLSIFHSTVSETAPSVTLATSVCVPTGRFSVPRSSVRLLVGFGTSVPFSVHVTGRTLSAGWLVLMKTTSSCASGRVLTEWLTISAAAADGVTVVSPTVHVRVCTKRGPL